MSDEPDEDKVELADDVVEHDEPDQAYGCALCGAVTYNDNVGGHKDSDDRTVICASKEFVKYPARYNQFVLDMEEAGFKTEHYNGRCYYKGPAVRVDQYEDPDEVVRATKVKIQRDSMGLGQILYPR
jgi:hypothetical protein